MSNTFDYYAQSSGGTPPSQFSNQASWQTAYNAGLQNLNKQDAWEDMQAEADDPFTVSANSNDAMAQMQRRSKALMQRSLRQAKQRADFDDSMGKSFGKWGKDNAKLGGPHGIGAGLGLGGEIWSP